MTTDAAAIHLTCTGRNLLRPPREELLFTARLDNPTAGDLWIVLPDDLSDRHPLAARIVSLDRYELGPAPAHVLHGLGDGGFLALLFAAGGRLELTDLPLASWGGLPGHAEVWVTCASTLTIDGRPVDEVLSVAPQGQPAGPVDASPLADQRSVVQAIEAPMDGALSIAFADATSRSLTVELP